MRIISATVRNYRVHRELGVTFDRALTLIGGPNESGKSTLVEAIHRALFMKARGTSEEHKATRSDPFTGHPEVELTFEARGVMWRLLKRFSGTTGTASLSPENGATLRDAEAEAKLAELLGVEAATGNAMLAQWAHVWVEQGNSGRDPSESARTQQGRLINRLQELGAAAVLQSPFDMQVAGEFSKISKAIFTSTGAVRAGSDLSRAIAESEEAEQKRYAAEKRVSSLDATAATLRGDLEDLAAVRESRARLKAQSEELTGRERSLNELRLQEYQHASDAEKAMLSLAQAREADQSTTSAVEYVLVTEDSLAPKADEVVRLTNARASAAFAVGAAETADGTAAVAARDARRRSDLAVAYVERFEKADTLSKVQARAVEAGAIRAAMASLETQLAETPKVDKKKLKALQKAREELLTARATLDAMATSLEVRAADAAVCVGGESLAVGDARILTDGVEITVGSGVRLFVQPGGGTSLAEAKLAADEAQASLDELLGELGLASVDAAAQAQQTRSDLDTVLAQHQARLDAIEVDGLDEELQQALQDSQVADAEVASRSAAVGGFDAPSDLAGARAQARDAKQVLKDAETSESDAKEDRTAAIEKLSELDSTLAAVRAEMAEREEDLRTARAQRDHLLGLHGDGAARTARVELAERACEATGAQLEAIRSSISLLDPEGLEADTKRLERAIEGNSEQARSLERSVDFARADLRVDGSVDPRADLANAVARAQAAGEVLERLRRRGKALTLLDDLFTEEQRSLGQRLTKPLVDKINVYLRPVFGTSASVAIEYNGAEFSGLSLRRVALGHSPFPFDVLSGGAKEQLACAVRLATAELLAADHDDCLPLVLDDAFAYSDGRRVSGVHRMLDLAASRGLQVIVLSCNPADYEALGATPVRLTAAEPVQGQALAAPEEPLRVEDAAVFASHDEDKAEPTSASPPGVREPQERFLLLLNAHGGRCGNIVLRRELGWGEELYDGVKGELLASGKIVLGQGRGGTVSIAGKK